MVYTIIVHTRHLYDQFCFDYLVIPTTRVCLFYSPSFDIDHENQAVHGNWIVAVPHNRGANKKDNGVGGHLYAIMGEVSVKSGFGGFFYGKAANQKLLDHYIEKFGAESGGFEPYAFPINEEKMHKLLDKYNFEWREN